MRSALHYQLAHRFGELCRRLKESATERHLAAPLVFWAAPQDHRLPKPLLEYSTARIVETPFAKLAAAPCVGVKKLTMLNELLERAVAAAQSDPPPTGPDAAATSVARSIGVPGEASFDPAALSRSQWSVWCASIKQHDLARQPLGRFAVTLRDLPAKVWHTPLSTYADLTLDELYRQKTHGKKRIRVVVEVFALVQSLLGKGPTHLSVHIAPRFAAPVETWLLDVWHQDTAGEGFPSAGEVQQSFLEPLLAQLRQDLGPPAYLLTTDRLRADSAEFSATAAANELGLTRQRIYQLLKEASVVMSVRWPEGNKLVRGLFKKAVEAPSQAGASLFRRGGLALSSRGDSGGGATKRHRKTCPASPSRERESAAAQRFVAA